MKIKYYKKADIKRRMMLPTARQPCKQHNKGVEGRSNQRQKIPHRVVRRGC